MHIKQTHIPAALPNLLKEHVSPAHGVTDGDKARKPNNMYKKLPDSALLKLCSSSLIHYGLISLSFEVGNISYI